MKIFQVIQRPQLRGAETFACQLGNHLIRSGDDCIIVSVLQGGVRPDFNGRWIALDRDAKLKKFDFRAWKKFADLVHREKPDLIQANASDTLKFVVFSKVFFGWKTRVVYRNANKISDFIDSKLKYLFNKFLVDRVDFVISVSEMCRKDFIETFSYSASRISVGTIGIEPRSVGKVPDDLDHIYRRGRVCVNIGGMVPEKNQKALLKMFNVLLTNDPTLQLIILGEGKLKAQLVDYAAQLSISDNVHIPGHRKDVLEILGGASVFLLPSLIEGLPASILEAQYCRVPVVTYGVGGIGEIIHHEVTGWLIRKNDEESFIEAVEKVLDEKNSAHVNDIREKAFQMVMSDYKNESVARNFRQLYEKVIGTANTSE
jgi:L-malate glycosyltransferase